MNEEYLVVANHLNKSFEGRPAVIDVSLKVRKGEIFGFLGPNGSGKTTTIRMLCGLMTPDSGSGECLGYNILTESNQIKRLVGYVPQTFSLYHDLTVDENLAFIAQIYGMKNYKQRVKVVMAELGLDRYERVLAGKLSGGWKQRLSLAAAMIHEPKLLLLDEPTAGVDPKARREFWNYIAYLTTQGISSLVSTHYMDEAERCNRLAYIVYGHLMAEGTVQDIIDQAHLLSWSVSGANSHELITLAEQLRQLPGLEQVVAWGNELRVSGNQDDALQLAQQKFSGFHWQKVTPSLEEVFIHLVGGKTMQVEKVK